MVWKPGSIAVGDDSAWPLQLCCSAALGVGPTSALHAYCVCATCAWITQVRWGRLARSLFRCSAAQGLWNSEIQGWCLTPVALAVDKVIEEAFPP